ncbi:MarR family winged helix-turn-helix transcriptional regulator [Aliikangiella sp. G2MR2-5]|uniref:MarR family winged helix-turn-helix transcriptional regulator n=1 Tax=Aliikangiella sp. G2MR2-5 TaxID=2788943 RepID=UPI0018A89332|nr:MarR family transcriptional regulator [Aliikangiella sp. G2MR2-5]
MHNSKIDIAPSDNDYLDTLGSPYLAHFARRLADLIIEQGTTILLEKGMVTPSTALSTVFYLDNNQNVTVACLANALSVSHQMATQRINSLIKLGLVTKGSSDKDKRAKYVVLTRKGKEEVKQLIPFVQNLARAFEELESDLECQLTQVIRDAEKSLLETPLKERLSNLSGH